MKTKTLKKLITDNEDKINFGDTDNLHSLPCSAKIYYQAYQYHLEIKVEADSNELLCQILEGNKINILSSITITSPKLFS